MVHSNLDELQDENYVLRMQVAKLQVTTTRCCKCFAVCLPS